jgi:hypothetical protein
MLLDRYQSLSQLCKLSAGDGNGHQAGADCLEWVSAWRQKGFIDTGALEPVVQTE